MNRPNYACFPTWLGQALLKSAKEEQTFESPALTSHAPFSSKHYLTRIHARTYCSRKNLPRVFCKVAFQLVGPVIITDPIKTASLAPQLNKSM